MAHQITLSDDEYAALVAASTRTGASIEELVHQALAARFPASGPVKQIGSYSYPTGAPLTPEEREEMKRLAQELGSGRPWLSEMVIEDRGPR